MKAAVKDNEVELANVVAWRIEWLRVGGFNKRNAALIAQIPTIDWRYANQVLHNCKEKGFDEAFAVKLLV
jgi:hypothetical protein